jgi:hypothetical protein
MAQAQALYQWETRVATFFPDLPPSRRAWLALVSFGIVLAPSALLNRVVLRLAVGGGQSFNTVRQRLRQLYRPPRDAAGPDCSFAFTACFGPRLRWATAGFTDRRWALARDPTNLGERFTILTVRVVFRGCAVPVAGQGQRGDQPGSWNDHGKRLLGRLRDARGDGGQVLVLSDRGRASQELFEALTALGWHPLMRVKKAGHCRPEGWRKSQAMNQLVPTTGRRWRGRGVAWPSSSRLPGTLLACWEEGHADAWLIVTDLAPGDARARWYAGRSWIEPGLRDLKSDGWDWSKTRMTDPHRVARWWAAAALAPLWVLEAGAAAQRVAIPATKTHAGAGPAAVTSLFALGLAWLAGQLGRGWVRRLRRLPQPDWPHDPSDSDPQDQQNDIMIHPTIPL